ncbi:MAG: Ig-like domain-containing protein [Myxococcota bacterium]
MTSRIAVGLLVLLTVTACPSEPPDPSQLDQTPPSVVSMNPADGATDVARDAKVSVVFSEAVTSESLHITLAQGGNDLAKALLLSPDGKSVTLTPAAPLPEASDITVTVAAGYADAAGNAGAQAAATFTTRSDVPSVVSTTPADGAQNVAVDTAVSAVFSEPMQASTLDETTFFLREGSNSVAATVSYEASTRTARLVPGSNLLEGRVYLATITSAALDSSSTPLAAAKTWTFTTAATVPSVTGVLPLDGAVNVPGNSSIQITFSEPMDPSSLDDTSVLVTAAGSAIPGTRSYDGPSRTLTFQPTGAYPGGAAISLNVTTSATDTSGIPLGQAFQSSFTVSNAPAVSSSIPSPNDTGVALSSTVRLNFSAAMDVTTLVPANVHILDAANAQVAASYTATASDLTMAPTAPLKESTAYTVVVTTNVRSLANVPFVAEYRFSFRTLDVPPTVVAINPADGAQNVPVATKIQVTFDEDMDVASFTSSNLRLSNGAVDVAGTVAALNARTLEFTPGQPLRELASYVVIATSGLRDLAGNGLANEVRSSFRTEPLPRIASVLPAPGEVQVPLRSAIVLTFNKPLDASTVGLTPAGGQSPMAFTLYQGASSIEGGITYDAASRTVRIVRQSSGAAAPWVAGQRYLLEMRGSILKDASGNFLGGRQVTTFVAGASDDVAAPSVVSTSPSNGEIGVARDAVLVASFDEAVDPSTLSTATVRVLDGAAPISGRVEAAVDGRSLRFIPDQPLPAAKALSFVLDTGIKDLSGNAKTLVNTIAFTTQENVAPSVARFDPPNGAIDVKVNRAVRIDFTEPVAAASINLEVLSGASPVPGTLRYDDATRSATFTPTADLPPNASIDLKVKAGLADREGAASTTDATSRFSTVADSSKDVVKPAVSGSAPLNGALGVAARGPLTVTFSEGIDPATALIDHFSITERGGAKVPFGFRYDAANERGVLTPSIPLGAGKTYDVQMGAGIRDLAGNALDAAAGSSTVSFTVDGQAPAIVSRSPAANSTVGTNVRVELELDEALDPSTLDADSLLLKAGNSSLLAAVWYDAPARRAYLQPAVSLGAGPHTVELSATRVADLAGNLVGSGATYGFTVSTSGPSVVGVTPCGAIVDVDDLGTQTILISFDRGVAKVGGGALDGTAVKLRLNNADVAGAVGHSAGAASALVTPSVALAPGSVYEVQATTQVVDAATNAPMVSPYSCTFRTQVEVFRDNVDDLSTAGYTVGAAQGGNSWQRINSVDDVRNSIVWRGGNSNDGQNYSRHCALSANDYTVFIEKQIDLTGLSQAEVRFDELHDIAGTAGDLGQVLVVQGGTTTVLASYSSTGPASYSRVGKASGNLSAFVGSTVKLRFELFIKGYSALVCGGAPAGKKGLFIDNIHVVGH